MNLIIKTITVAALGCLVLFAGGCASSHLVDTWHDSTYKAQPLGKVLVVAVRKDAAKRRLWEDAFASELSKHGVATTLSYTLFPDAPPDTEQVISAVQANGFDGIVAVFRLPTEVVTEYVKGYVTTEQEVRFNPYWQRYRNYYRVIEHPGYVDTRKVAINAIDITSTGEGGRLIWSATSRTPDPKYVTDAQDGIVALVGTDLQKLGIIGGQK